MNTSEGVVKFSALHEEKRLQDIDSAFFEALNNVRTQLHDLNMVNVLPNGIGFGNVSRRLDNDRFLISGTSTGKERILNLDDYAIVNSFNIAKNSIFSIGLTKASSESLTHGAIYQANKNVQAVIHVHHKKLFDDLIKSDILSLSETIEYGTPELAFALYDCASKNETGIIATKGHQDGIYAWSTTIEKAFKHILSYTYI